MKKCVLVLSVILISAIGYGQLYKDSTQSIDIRVQDLLARMTLEEKFWQVFMIPSDGDTANKRFQNGIFGLQVSAGNQGDANGQLLTYNTSQNAAEVARKINDLQRYFTQNTRLGIPIIPFDEALHGLVRQGATAYPQAIGLAATWDTTLIGQVGTQIASTCKTRGIRQILSPVVNLATDVRWGRTEETYGEDPFLTGAIGSSFIRAFEQNGVIATPKHFLANVSDGGRDSYPVFLSEWYLEQSHLLPFRKVIQTAGARSVMTAYNSLNGTACSSNDWLLTQKLKKEWGFQGFVISDANAVGGEVVLHGTASNYAQSGAHAINAGLDVIFQTDYAHAALFYPAFENGLVDSVRLNNAVSRVLRAKFELGLFEHPYVPIPDNIDSLVLTGKKLAQSVAEKSFVLLKNNNNLLPISSTDTRIALFGYDAAHTRLGGYSGPGNNPVSILEGLKELYPSISYLEAVRFSDTDFVVIPEQFLKTGNQPGLHAQYFPNTQLTGEPVNTRQDAPIDFNWTIYGPTPGTGNHFYSTRWTGELIAPENGTFQFGLEGNDGYRLYWNDQLLIDRWEKTGFHRDLHTVKLVQGKAYPIRIEFREPKSNGKIRLIWNYGVKDTWNQDLKTAIRMTRKSDIAIVVAGIHEGEFQDRASLELPGKQEALIQALHETGKPVIVLLVGGSAITMNNWIDQADAIMCLWYPGEAAGNAVANILSGKRNPAGRLPITFPASEAQLPLTYNHLPTGRGDDYYNLSGEPLFPFGFGISYTSFDYSNPALSTDTIQTGTTATLRFKLTNTGKYDGDEVVQLYIKPIHSVKAQPVLSLKGFQRIPLKQGASQDISFQLTSELFLSLNDSNRWSLEPGIYEILIGSSSHDLKLMKRIVVQP